MRQEEVQERAAPPTAKGKGKQREKKFQERDGPIVKCVKRERMGTGFGNRADTGDLENQPRSTAARGTQVLFRDCF